MLVQMHFVLCFPHNFYSDVLQIALSIMQSENVDHLISIYIYIYI